MIKPFEINLKQGETFSYADAVALPAGTWTGEAHLRQLDGTLVEALSVEVMPPISPATDHVVLIETADHLPLTWAIGVYEFDVKLKEGGAVALISNTYTVKISGAKTHV